MARNIVKAKLDVVFKKLFMDEGNQHILQAFLSDILPFADAYYIMQLVIKK